MTKKEIPDIKNTGEVHEPDTLYPRLRQIQLFTSFSESEEVQYRHWARLSPEDRLSEFFVIMSGFYAFTKPNWKGTKINFNQ